MKLATYSEGDYICQQGKPGESFFVIIEGSCKVTVSDEATGAERSIGERLCVEEYFGEVGDARTSRRDVKATILSSERPERARS
jgi:CRP-like cAMP-binding protein